jgi:hypothetical protein
MRASSIAGATPDVNGNRLRLDSMTTKITKVAS